MPEVPPVSLYLERLPSPRKLPPGRRGVHLRGLREAEVNPQYFYFWKKAPRDRLVDRIAAFLRALPTDREWEICVKPHQKKRSTSQNNYLWGVCYPTILRSGGEALAGWTADDLHEYFLSLHFGSEVLHLNGRDFERPVRRSSKLNTVEFMDFVARIQLESAQLGVFIPDPDPEYYRHQERAA